VLELGARVVGSMTTGWRDQFVPGCAYLANDIHPGPGIDVVGDVHALTRHVAPGSLDGVFSVAVLEHLAAPWLAAAEIARALRIGGETLHVTHQCWPLHETPNDFFRMSDQALRSLFSPERGFEILDCGMAYPCAIVPPPDMRHTAWLRVPLGRGWGQSYVRARKVAEPAGAVDPLAMERISQAYPRPG
jgi:SAM-dependent methyltransferase